MENKGQTYVALIGGARPNFMKIAPLCRALDEQHIAYQVINTGQHFSAEMADDFFVEFGIRADHTLKPSHENPVKQMADIMQSLETLFQSNRPALVVVVGDVNSTLAAGLVANKLSIPLAHVEAGLRSRNLSMPEEMNRMLTDRMADLLFATSSDAEANIKQEGIEAPLYVVGNVMIDTLLTYKDKGGKKEGAYYFCTLHRGENVDKKHSFEAILDALEEIAKDAQIYLPLHPRTKKRAETFGLMGRLETIFTLLPPLSYTEAIAYQRDAQLVLTDSGGIQEETSVLGVPCLTLRAETERPITVELGTNIIAGVQTDSILTAYRNRRGGHTKIAIPLWDGKASERIATHIQDFLKDR